MKKSSLTDAIKEMYSNPIEDKEVNEAENNLLLFFELLIEIDAEHDISRANGCEVQP